MALEDANEGAGDEWVGDKPLVITLPAPVSDHSGCMAEPCSREGFSGIWAPVLQASGVCRRGRKIFFV